MKIYSTKQAAEYLGMTVEMVRYYIRTGKLTATLVGRDYLVTERSLKAFKK